MSQDDLKTYGTTIGMGTMLDNVQSMRYNTPSTHTTSAVAAFPGTTVGTLNITGGLIGGNGMVNSSVFANSGGFQLVTSANIQALLQIHMFQI